MTAAASQNVTTSRRYRWAIGFIAPVIGLELVLRLLAPVLPAPGPWLSAEYSTMIRAAQEQQARDARLDVLFVGSSISDAAIDPDQLREEHRISSFNAAGAFLSPVSAEQWLDQGLWEFEPTELIIGQPVWGTDFGGQADVLATAFSKLEEFRSQQRWFGWSELWNRRSQLRRPYETYSDIVISRLVTDSGHFTGYYDRLGEPLPPSEGGSFPGIADVQLVALENIVTEAQSRGIAVTLMLEPGGCPPIYPRCGNAETEQQAEAFYQALAEDLDVAYFSARSFDAEPTWWADGAHFNQAGTQAFTAFIGEWLASR